MEIISKALLEWRNQKDRIEEGHHTMKKLIDEIKGFLGALIVALLIRTFLIQPFVIPSASMYPTLEIGDFILVLKHTFGYSNYSFPFAPKIIENRLFESSKPQRGDVLVFRNPIGETTSLLKKIMFQDESLDFIKRLIGLPGDRIQIKEGVLHINGEPVKLEKLEDYTYHDPRSKEDPIKHKAVNVMSQYVETLPNGVSYRILRDTPSGKGNMDDTPEYVVPEGHYFFLGDNRDHSGDSRFQHILGFVPEDHIIGPARWIFFSTEAKWYEVGQWISGIRPSRIFTAIH
jgi:signal peptidase I